jgi:hypothetical protein
MAIAPRPSATPSADSTTVEPKVEESKDKEWDGQGDRLRAVRLGHADADLVYNGLTNVPQAEQVKTDEHTGRYVAVSTIGRPEEKEPEPLREAFAPGDVVEGFKGEQLRSLISSGAVRLETKDEAKGSDKK